MSEREKRGHPRFHELLDVMADLHSRKNQDYAGNRDPMFNLRMCADVGIPPWKGVIVRLSDKWARLLTFAQRESYAVADEKVTDTLMDLACYSVLCIILYEEKCGLDDV